MTALRLGAKSLGFPVVFRESVEPGYQIAPLYISAMIGHISNANVGSQNAGITGARARVGMKF
jgi:hypothetical protein